MFLVTVPAQTFVKLPLKKSRSAVPVRFRHPIDAPVVTRAERRDGGGAVFVRKFEETEEERLTEFRDLALDDIITVYLVLELNELSGVN